MIIRLPIGMVGSNTYLLYDEEGREGAIIDPGGETAPLLKEIERHKVQVQYLLNTHAHFDHIASNNYIKLKFDARLGLHPNDLDLLLEGGGAAWFGLAYVPSPPPDIDLVDSKKLKLGTLHIEVIHTPGHTPGSVCLHVPEEKALFTGDTLFADSVGRTDLPGGDPQRLTKSLRALLSLPDDTLLYPGHGASTTLADARQYNPWIKRLQNAPK